MRTSFFAAALFLLVPLLVAAQPNLPDSVQSQKGTYLGVLFGPIPPSLRAHLPKLPPDGGVLITHVLPQSPAAGVELKRHDILLRFDNTQIRDGLHLAKLIQNNEPGETVTLALMHHGQVKTTKVKLGLGPILLTDPRGTSRNAGNSDLKPGIAKKGRPDELSVSAIPMDGNCMAVTFEFYQENKGRYRKVICSGTPDMIDQQIVDRLPKPVQSLANHAVEHLRKLQFQQKKSTQK